MPLLNERDAQEIRQIFAQGMTGDVQITLFTQKSTLLTVPGREQEIEYCKTANQLLEEVSALSDRIHVTAYDIREDSAKFEEFGIEHIPAILLGGADEVRPARFYGVTSGYEFSTFIQDILDLSTGTIELSEATLDWARNLQEDVHIQVFGTPT